MKEKVSSGDELRIQSRTWNELIDAKNDFLRRKGVFARPAVPARQQTKIKNETGDDLETGDVVELGDYALDDSVRKQNIIWLTGVLPDGTHRGFAILANAIPNGQIGRCFTSGTCMARVNVSDLNHQFAKVAAGQTILESAASGPVRLDSVPSEGPGQECIVTISPHASDNLIVFELTDQLPLQGEAEARQCELNGDEYEATGETITVCDPYRGFGMWRGLAGARGLASLRSDDKYDIVFMERDPLIIEFTTAADRDPTETLFSATVTSYWQHGDLEPESEITIYDPQFLFPHALAGGKGLAIYNERTDSYRCLIVQQQCLTAVAQVDQTGGLVDAGATQIRNFIATSTSPFNLAPSPLPTSALNDNEHYGKDGDFVQLIWDESDLEWHIIDVEKKVHKVLTGIRINAAKTFIEAESTQMAVEYAVDPGYANEIPLKTC